VLFLLMAAVLFGRAAQLQVFGASAFVDRAEGLRERRLLVAATRGSILDRNANAMVMTVPASTVTADPTKIVDGPGSAAKLAPLLGVEAATVLAALERPDTRYSMVAEHVDTNVGDQIRALQLPGIVIQSDPDRLAVGGVTAGALVGSLSRTDGEAQSGLERKYNALLSASDGLVRLERTANGETIPGSEQLVRAARDGSDIQLTLDRPFQWLAERALLDGVAASGGLGGTVIIGRPGTGELLAMASATTSNTGLGPGALNLAVRTYEPGSVMKPMVVATAFNDGIVRPESTFTVADQIRLYDRTIRDSHRHPTEVMTVDRILAESSNVGTILIAQQVGKERIVEALRSFGFGQSTALGLGVEQAGILKSPQDWYGTDIGSVPIGQSVTVTPLQLWAAYSTIANGGIYVPPKLVQDIVDAEGRHIGEPAAPSRRVVSAEAALQTAQALQQVVEDGGTGAKFSIPGYHVAAKTGTAYKPFGDGTYGNARVGRKYAATFAGFFPVADPQIVMVVMIDEPKPPRHYGAAAAGPVFDRLAREAIRRYGIPGDNAATAQPRGGQIRAAVTTRPVPTTTTTLLALVGAPTAPGAPAPGGPVVPAPVDTDELAEAVVGPAPAPVGAPPPPSP